MPARILAFLAAALVTLSCSLANPPKAHQPHHQIALSDSVSERWQPPPEPPEPQVVKTDMLIGAINYPGWREGAMHWHDQWEQMLKHPERTPILGFYSQNSPAVNDWDAKWALEHGISFFVYCWYRNGLDGPVQSRDPWLEEGLFKSRYLSKMKFSILWVNGKHDSEIGANQTLGIANEADLLERLLPFWVNNYFRHPSYLKIDNKPLLFIYRPEVLSKVLGGVENTRKAFDKMRQAVRKAGFDGIYLIGEYRKLEPDRLQLMKNMGLDYSFAYTWPIPNNPAPQTAISTQMQYLSERQAMGFIPEIPTASVGWSGWHDEGSIWRLPPNDFKVLLEKEKAYAQSLPKDQLGHKVLLLDNWNEWGEGHYIGPHRQYGFGYLDAVRDVFSSAPPNHKDLTPEDMARPH